MPVKASTKPVRARSVRRSAAKPLAVASRKKVATKAAIAAAKTGGFHLGRYAVLAGLAAAAAASALAFLPESVTGDVKKQVKAKGKAARASVGDAEKFMKDAIEAARAYASNALH